MNIHFNKYIKFLILGLIIIFNTACSNNMNKINEDIVINENMFQTTEENETKYDNSKPTTSNDLNYSFAYGPIDQEQPIEETGDGLKYSAFIKNDGPKAQFGIAVSIDGYMQKINDTYIIMDSVEEGEEKIFELFITNEDLILEARTKHIVQLAVILEPEFIPDLKAENIYEKSFFMRGELKSTVPIVFNLENNKQPQKGGVANTKKLDEDIKDKLKLSDSIAPNIEYDNLKSEFISKEDLRNTDIYILSNSKVEKRLYMMVNNEPVSLNSSPFIELSLNKGIVNLISIDDKVIDILNPDDIVYFLALPTDNYSEDDLILKTESRVIKNEINY